MSYFDVEHFIKDSKALVQFTTSAYDRGYQDGYRQASEDVGSPHLQELVALWKKANK